jgi:hypothetical protein
LCTNGWGAKSAVRRTPGQPLNVTLQTLDLVLLFTYDFSAPVIIADRAN